MALRKTLRADLRRTTGLLTQAGIAFALVLLIAAFRADLRTAPPVVHPAPPRDVIPIETIVQTIQHREPPPPPKPAAIVEVVDAVKLDDIPIGIDDLKAQVVKPLGPPPAPTPAIQPYPEPEERIFIVVEEEPELIGGLVGLQSRITYPEVAKRAGIEGRVSVQFVVDETGRVRDAFVVRGIGGGCDEEALEAVENARFTPGKQRGKAVKVQMTLPVTFRLR